jgi:hypothetical protein
MICPVCSDKSKRILAWNEPPCSWHSEPDVFSQYRCQQGHYFETIRVFDGTCYQESLLPSRQRTSSIKSVTASMN